MTSFRDVDIVVAILTYRRAEQLRRLLPLVLDQAARLDPPVHVVVIDNDPQQSGAPVVTEFAALRSDADRLQYLSEPTPGISAARNRALRAADGAAALVFIDDDEVPKNDWLATLVGCWRTYRCAAVTGPVVPDFATPPSAWVSGTRQFDRRRLATGTALHGAATNNLLLDLAFLTEQHISFDESIGLIGGEDTLLTHAIVKRGGTIRWCDEAEVIDPVPANRMTKRWILRRAFRAGTSWSRTELTLSDTTLERFRRRTSLVARALVRGTTHLGRAIVNTLLRRQTDAAYQTHRAASYAGLLAGAFGVTRREYRRIG